MQKTIHTRSLILTLTLGLFALSFSFFAHAGGNEKVEICHFTSSVKNPVVIISVSERAVQTHLDHGDTLYDPEFGCEEDDGGGGPAPV